MGIRFSPRPEQAPAASAARIERLTTVGMDHVYLSTETADVVEVPLVADDATDGQPEFGTVALRNNDSAERIEPLLTVLSEQSHKLLEQGARIEYLNYRVGFLEGVLDLREEQVRLLPDFRAKAASAILLERKTEELEAQLAKAQTELASLSSRWWVKLVTWLFRASGK